MEADSNEHKSREESNKNFYEKLKKSTVPKTNLPETTQVFEQSLSFNKKYILKQITEINSTTTVHKSRGIHYHGQLDHEILDFRLI